MARAEAHIATLDNGYPPRLVCDFGKAVVDESLAHRKANARLDLSERIRVKVYQSTHQSGVLREREKPLSGAIDLSLVVDRGPEILPE